MPRFRKSDPNVVIFGDSNTYVFGPSLSDWYGQHHEFSASQVSVEFKSGSKPIDWLVGSRKDLWRRVRSSFSIATKLVVVGLGGNMSRSRRDREAIESLVNQVLRVAPKAKIIWRGPPPATQSKSGVLATEVQKLKRYQVNKTVKEELRGFGFSVLDAESVGDPWSQDTRRVFLDLISLHAGGPSRANARTVGRSADLVFEREVLESETNSGRSDGEVANSGPWASLVRARDDMRTPTHVPRSAADDFYSIVGETGVLDFENLSSTVQPRGRNILVGATCEIRNSDARRRKDPPAFRWDRTVIPQGTIVEVVALHGEHVQMKEPGRRVRRWTLLDNLSVVESKAEPKLVWRVIDADTRLRTQPPKFRWTRKRVSVGTRVCIVESSGHYAKIDGVDGEELGWTARSNLEQEKNELVAEPPEPLVVEPDIFTVIDSRAVLRDGPTEFAPRPGEMLPRHGKFRVDETNGSYAFVRDNTGQSVGWTKSSNLRLYFKDTSALQRASLQPVSKVSERQPTSTKQRIARTYNRLGGLMDTLARILGIETEAVLAVWMAESSGKVQAANHMTIRFENHVLYRRWGHEHTASYDRHYQHGGHRGVVGKSYKNHRCRLGTGGRWETFHGSQDSEYKVFRHTEQLAGSETACRSISMGGPKIMGFHYTKLGYENASEMYAGLQLGERMQVLGFFDFCRTYLANERLITPICRRDWDTFGHRYNGSKTYGPKISNFYSLAKRLLNSHV